MNLNQAKKLKFLLKSRKAILLTLFLPVFFYGGFFTNINIFSLKVALAVSPEIFNITGLFVPPAGVYAVTVECRGGGGGGSIASNNVKRPGGGGGGGAYSKTNSIAVTPGTSYTVTVATQVAQQVNGLTSSFTGDSGQTCVAAGGLGVAADLGGAGGTTAASVGDVKYAGGAGGTAVNTNGYGGAGGGEGGRSNGTGGAGQPNVTTVGGAGGTGGDGGDGGKGGNNTLPGLDGVAPGGGGGGAGGYNDVAGKGAPGQCIITYASTSDIWAPSIFLAPYTPKWIFSTPPTNVSSSQISMVATTGFDLTTPINYLFTSTSTICGTNTGTGGLSSSWQGSTTYVNSGLQPNKCYGYTVTARDSVTIPNVGTPSDATSTYSSANVPGTPILSGATLSTLNLSNNENSNPSVNPTTYFAVQVVTTTPNDSNWINKWVNASGAPSATAVWMTDAELDVLVLSGLVEGTIYGVKVKARNQDGDETSLSVEGQGTTQSSGTLTTDIVDATGASVSTSTINFNPTLFSFNFQTATGTFGTTSEKIRVNNTTSNQQWSLSIGATAGPTALWQGVTNAYDFNDPTANAVDGADADLYGGQMTINASTGTITPKSGCTIAGLTLGSSWAFSQVAMDSITLLTAGVAAQSNCYWDLTGVSVSQTIPKEQEADAYSLSMTLSIIAI